MKMNDSQEKETMELEPEIRGIKWVPDLQMHYFLLQSWSSTRQLEVYLAKIYKVLRQFVD